MSTLEFIAAMTKELAYPVVIVIAIAVFHAPLARLIDRLRKVSHGDTAAEFDEAAVDVKELLVKIGGPIQVHAEQSAQSSNWFNFFQPERAVSDAEIEPTIHKNIGKVIIAWNALENMVKARLEAANVSTKNLHGERLLTEARLKQILTTDQFNSLRGLYVMRNLAAHGRADDITEERVTEFILLANAMGVVLDMTKTNKM